MLITHSWTKRPREALLQFDIELGLDMFRIGGSLGTNEIPPLSSFNSNFGPLSGSGDSI